MQDATAAGATTAPAAARLAAARARDGSGAPDEGAFHRALRRPLVSFLIVLAQFAFIWLLLHRLNIDTPVARRVFTLALLGFIVHAWLPDRWRLPFFGALSLSAVALVFGTHQGEWSAALGAARGGWLVGLGIGLILLCRLPGPIALRAGAVAAAAGALAALRIGAVPSPIPPAVWPILASMFMFRGAIYLYDTARERPPAAHAMSYFFLLPNPAFPFFPVVDFKAFVRGRFDTDSIRIYQKGLWWMTRGVIHLLLYRVVYNHLRVSPAGVLDGVSLAQYMLSCMGLYLRVSGMLHLIVGLLHMFGFNLPETNRRYFFAASFNDYWRRVNIYWKDFILKVVYKPVYFRLKGLGLTAGMALATLVAFFVTWLLHAYQEFWLRGASFPLLWKDVVFWGALGALVTVNSVWEAKFGRTRSLTPGATARRSPRAIASLALRVAGTFLTLTVLWSVWYCSSIAEWADIAGEADVGAVALLLAVALAIGALACIPALDPPATAPGPFFRGPVMGRRFRFDIVRYVLVPAAALYILQSPRVFNRFGPETADIFRGVKQGVRRDAREEAQQARGYYENLINVGHINSPLADVFGARPPDWKRLETSTAVRPVSDFRAFELVPNADITLNGVRYQTNSLGLRDREHALAKAPGAFRLALLGSSHVLGLGVDAERTFAWLLEDRLTAPAPGRRLEVWNFAFNGYGPLSQPLVLDHRVRGSLPDAVLYVAHASDFEWSVASVARVVCEGREGLDPALHALAESRGVRRGMTLGPSERRLRAKEDEIVSIAYRAAAERIRALGAAPVWVLLPFPGQPDTGSIEPRLARIAADAGFTILSVDGVFDGHRPDTLRVSEWDGHFSPQAHSLIAERLEREVRASPAFATLFHPSDGAAPSPSAAREPPRN